MSDVATLEFPNAWAKFRYKYRAPLAEYFATCVMICFGNGVNCQVVLNGGESGQYLSISWGWGIGVMVAIYLAGGISGAHLNPSVTVALAVYRKFPWRQVPGYILAQVLGCMTGSIIVQANYRALINQFEGGNGVRTFGQETSTGALFFTAASPWISNVSAFFSEFLITAILIMFVFAMGDPNNIQPPAGMAPFIIGLLIVGIGAALGLQTAYCLNFARDFGPRVAAAIYGYPGAIWSYRDAYWVWTCAIATVSGGLFGGLIYDAFLYTGEDSWLNRPFGRVGKEYLRSKSQNTVEIEDVRTMSQKSQ